MTGVPPARFTSWVLLAIAGSLLMVGGDAARTEGIPPIHHIVVASVHHPNQDVLLKQAKILGYSVTVLGVGDADIRGGGDQLGKRLVLIHAFCQSLPNPDDLVLVTDAWDVAVTVPLPAVYRAYQNVLQTERARYVGIGATNHGTAEIVEGAEAALWPATAGPYPVWSRGLRFRFVNGGTMMGPARAFLQLFSVRPPQPRVDDQLQMSETYLLALNESVAGVEPSARRSVPILLDHDSQLVLSLHNVLLDEVRIDTPSPSRRYPCGATFVPSGVRPAIMHGNGNGKQFLPLLCMGRGDGDAEMRLVDYVEKYSFWTDWRTLLAFGGLLLLVVVIAQRPALRRAIVSFLTPRRH